MSAQPPPADLFDDVFGLEEFLERPPLLLDIGASGAIHPEWAPIARHSVCIAFDADARDFGGGSGTGSGFRKLHLINCLVGTDDAEEMVFYLTRSPYCSSSLRPDADSLADWAFWELFEVERTVALRSRSLPAVLAELDVHGVDWFKTDSQGIDLRLFRSLGPAVTERVLVADFEPGLIDAYVGEDKLTSVITFMEGLPFWISDLTVQGPQRLNKDLCKRYAERLRDLQLKVSPGWGEISYLNRFDSPALLDRRSILLGWVVSIVKEQHGFALELLVKGEKLLEPALFDKLHTYTVGRLFRKRALKDRVVGKVVRTLEGL